MHHRPFGLLHSTLSFSAVLQAAAARAWARSSSSSSIIPPRTPNKPLVKPPDAAVVQYLQRNQISAVPVTPPPKRPSPSSHAVYFDPDAVCDSDLQPSVDPSLHDVASSQFDPLGRPPYWDDASIVGTTVGSFNSGVELGARATHFQLAKNPHSLYQNLLRLLCIRDPPPSLPVLLDYHDLHPGLRSTRSYNLLISLAIRTACYGTVKWLLKSMRADNVSSDIETWQLRVRWLVQSGKWDRAWKETMEVLPQMKTAVKEGGKTVYKVTGELPLSIWMEFFRTLKYGTTRKRSRQKKTSNSMPSGSTPSPPCDDSSDLYSLRYHTLMNNRPTVIPYDLTQTSPRLVYNTVWIMLHVGQADKALSFVKSYLKCLPRSITLRWRRTCLDILHLLIAKWSSRQGLPRFYETRRMMISLLSIYPTLRPTSTTLFLLLAPLSRAKRCGTIAASILRAFTSEYGAWTEDRRVRRRVAKLALKEGRMDIVDKILSAERDARRIYARWRLAQQVTGVAAKPLPQRLRRPPMRTIFRRNGQEERRWCRFIIRVSRTRRKHNRTK